MVDTAVPRLTTPPFRGSYVHLIKPKAVDKTKPDKLAYSMLIVLPKKDPATVAFMRKLEAAIQVASQEKHTKAVPKERLKHYPIQDGDASENEEVHGHWLVSAKNDYKPETVDTAGNILLTEDDVYSGAWYHASIIPWGWSHETGGKGVSIKLRAVLKVKDGDKFTSAAKAADDFADLLDGAAGSAGKTETIDDLLG